MLEKSNVFDGAILGKTPINRPHFLYVMVWRCVGQETKTNTKAFPRAAFTKVRPTLDILRVSKNLLMLNTCGCYGSVIFYLQIRRAHSSLFYVGPKIFCGYYLALLNLCQVLP
jgi:hypothetical protein